MSHIYPGLTQARRIAALAAPLSAVQLAQVAISTTDMVMLGWSGGTALAVGALGFTIFNLLRTMGFGLLVGTSNIVAERASFGLFRVHLHAAFLVATGAAAVAAAALLAAGYTLPWFGQDEFIVEGTTEYLAYIAPGMFPLFWFYAYRGVVVGTRRAKLLLFITLGTVVVNAVLDYGFLFGRLGLPLLGVPGVAASSSISYLLQFLAIAAITHRTSHFNSDQAGITLPGTIDRIMRIGLPTAGSYGSEAGFTTLIALMAGVYGTSALAAHATVNQLVYIVFMISIGLSHATSISVSEAVGAREASLAVKAGRAGLFLGLVVVLAFSAIFLTVPDRVLAFFSVTPDHDKAAYQAARGLLLLAAAIQVFDFAQNIAIGAVRAVGRAGVGFWITIGSYWLVGAPTAWLVGFHLLPGVLGVWIGMGAGLIAAAAGLVALFESAGGTAPTREALP